jgi:uncharacterized protein (DUF697 family)
LRFTKSMTEPKPDPSWDEQWNRAAADLMQTSNSVSKAAQLTLGAIAVASDELVGKAAEMSHHFSQQTRGLSQQAQSFVEQSTATMGRFVSPIVDSPVAQVVSHWPGGRWIMAALGRVNAPQTQAEVDKLRSENPLENTQQLAHRIIADTTLKAAGIGLVTNLLPPIALTLAAVDWVAITALQTQMIYRIAALYGFPLNDPDRRGEVLAILALALGGSSVLKLGLSPVEVIPGAGVAVGVAGDAALIYGLGHVACHYYETKRRSL